MAISVPQELIETIVGEIDDSRSLRACSLAARLFVVPSQRGLFRSLKLCPTRHGPSESPPFPSLPSVITMNAFLSTHPYIATYVCDLSITLSFLPLDQPAFESILRSFPNVERLVIYGPTEAVWHELTVGLRSALLDLVVQPSLCDMHLLSFYGLPPAFILYAASTVSVLKLTSITIDHGDHRSWLLKNSEQHVRLERLRLPITFRSAEYRERFLTAVSPILQHLELDLELSPLPESLNLPLMPKLHTIEIYLFIPIGRDFSATFPSATLVEMAAALPRVEVIILNIDLAPIPEDPSTPWRPRTSAPSINRGDFAHLRRVECRIPDNRKTGDEELVMNRVSAAVEELIPGLRGTGVLHCCVAGKRADIPARP